MVVPHTLYIQRYSWNDLLVAQDVAVDNVQRILGDTDNVLAGRRQAGINLKDLLEGRSVLVAILVQNGVLVLSLDELALVVVVKVVRSETES